MKLGIFLVLLGCCLYLTTARPNDSDFDDDKEGSQPTTSENSEDEEFDESDSEFELGNESDDDWIGDVIDDMSKEKKIENEGLNEEQVEKLEKLRRDRIQNEAQGKVHGSIQASARLMKELRDIYKSASFKNGAYSVELIDDSVYNWIVNLRHIDPDSDLYKDLQKLNKTNGQDSIILNFKFKETFPHSPPFVRVISPIIQRGHVMQGGAICTELLSSNGWSSVYTVEAVIMQISTLLVKGGGRIPQQNKNQAQTVYTEEYAKEALARMESTHKQNGWGNQGKD